MKKVGFYKQDWFVALLIGIAFSAALLSGVPFFEKLENLAYDTGVRMTPRSSGATENIAIVAIDDNSIAKIGRWPWPRNVIAGMLERLSHAEARVIGLLVFFTEPQDDPGLAYVRKLKDYVANTPFPKNAQNQAGEIVRFLEQAETDLDADGTLAKTLPTTHNLFMPMFFQVGTPLGKPDKMPPDFVRNNRLTKIISRPDSPGGPSATEAVHFPLERFGSLAAGIGHLNLSRDSSGGVRAETLVLEHYGEYYPSLALLMAARSLNLGPQDIEVNLGEGLKVERLYIQTSPNMQMLTGFYPLRNGESPFATYSFADVQSGNVPESVFRNKIVLIGSTAVGIGTTYLTPVNPDMNGPELTANMVASILNQDFYTRPTWATWVELVLFVAIIAYLMFALPRLGAGIAAGVSLVLLLALLGGEHFMLVNNKLWLRTVSPTLLLLVGHLLLTTKRFFTTEHQKQEVELDSVQTNRMLGLAFQGQGQLDMAMDKFRRLPVDESVLDLIYNLALDFERKRQFNKAASAYDYILSNDAKFRDTAERKKRASQADSTVIIGARGATAGGTMIIDGAGQKPTLGRYEVEKELGRGAMGTVYLGRDPKINRVVAIKTVSLQEFEAAELPQIKERFFREAETAGRLNHPNIVTIYDAGEEQDLAYIAMEFLQGKDLANYIKPGKPLPLPWVVSVVGKIADALVYAHTHDVVHRDIKPANIMYNEADKGIKVTDFGIARITASSRTKTGVILGSPSYMSPEQLAGKHVDGRSDLFSLGVMLFEMLTGKQPFIGDSMATLMFQIANEKHPVITSLRAEIPARLAAIVDKVLQKDPAQRYQTGAEMNQDLRECLRDLAQPGAKAG